VQVSVAPLQQTAPHVRCPGPQAGPAGGGTASGGSATAGGGGGGVSCGGTCGTYNMGAGPDRGHAAGSGAIDCP
jgi:hypothetical protein